MPPMPNRILRRLRLRSASSAGGGGGDTPVDPGVVTSGRLAAAPASSSSISLAHAAVSGADSYRYEASDDLASWSQVGTAMTPGYTETGLPAAHRRYYRFRSVAGGVPSAPSANDWATTFAASGSTVATPTARGAGWTEFGVFARRGAVPAGSGVRAGALTTQLDVKATWPDGSLKHGKATCKATGAGALAVAAFAAPTGTFTPSVPAFAVTIRTGCPFQSLGTFTPTSSTLSVVLAGGGSSDAVVVAEAVRVARASDGTGKQVVSTGDAGHTEPTGGSWQTNAWGGYDGSHRSSPANGCTAKFAFSGLTPGVAYSVAVTWTAWCQTQDSLSTWKVYDSNGTTVLGAFVVPQGITTSGSLPIPAADFVENAAVWTATAPTTPSADPWRSGPLCREWRNRVVPASGATPHPYLEAVFDTTSFNDGEAIFDLLLANHKNNAGTFTYAAVDSVTLAGSTVFTHGWYAHWWMNGWRKRFTTSGVATGGGRALPDAAALTAAGACLPYSADMSATVDAVTGPSFDFMGDATIPWDMGSAGEDGPRFGVMAQWFARYQAHPSAAQFDAAMVAADMSSWWPVHLNYPDGLPPDADAHPDFWFAYDGSYGPKGPWYGRGPHSPEHNHTIGWSYWPYLVTGERFHADELRYWANWGITSCGGDGSGGRTRWILYYQQTRGVARQAQNVGLAAAILPDGDAHKATFDKYLRSNLDFHDAEGRSPGPFGIVVGDANNSYVSTWQLSYLLQAIQLVNQLGLSGGPVGLDLQPAICRFTLQLFTQDPAVFDRDYACSLVSGGYLVVYVVGQDRNARSPLAQYADLSQLFHHQLLGTISIPGGTSPPPVTHSFTDYSIHSWVTLSLAARYGLSGAAAARDWLYNSKDPGHSDTTVLEIQSQPQRAGLAVDLSAP